MRISDWSSDVCSSDLGCTVQISTDGQATWTDIDTVTRPAIVGAATDALAAPEISSTGFDETNILTVTLPTTNELQSVTDERSEEHTSELQSLMRISYAVFCLKKKKIIKLQIHKTHTLTHTKHNHTC